MSKSGQDNAAPPQPVDVVDGVPDRSAKPAAWQYLTLAAFFIVWVAVLLVALLGWTQ